MSSVIKKKKESFFAKAIGKLKTIPSSNEQRDIACYAHLSNTYIDNDDMAAIESRRNELRTTKHGKQDAMVISKNVSMKH